MKKLLRRIFVSKAKLDRIKRIAAIKNEKENLLRRHQKYVCGLWLSVREKLLKGSHEFEHYLFVYEEYPEVRDVFQNCNPKDDILKEFVQELVSGQKPNCNKYRDLVDLQNQLLYAVVNNDQESFKEAIAAGADPQRVWSIDHGYELGDEWHSRIAIRNLRGHIEVVAYDADRYAAEEKKNELIERINAFLQ